MYMLSNSLSLRIKLQTISKLVSTMKPVSEFLPVYGVSTHILKYGNLPQQKKGILILIIPGNPGIMGYYEDFMSTLHFCSGSTIPVWGVSHAGHVKIPHDKQTEAPAHDPFSFQGQIEHKVQFLEKYIPHDAQLILIGHSIGCRIILEVMKRNTKHNIIKAMLLFPTIEKMATSPNGVVATPMLKYCRHIGVMLVYFLSFLPVRIQKQLISWHFAGQNVGECSVRASLNLFHPSCVSSSTYMAHCEMQEVTELDSQLLATIQKNLSKLIFYHGSTDKWCPVSYYEGFKKRFPDGDIRLCKDGHEHAFVLESAEQVGRMVWNWVQPLTGQ